MSLLKTTEGMAFWMVIGVVQLRDAEEKFSQHSFVVIVFLADFSLIVLMIDSTLGGSVRNPHTKMFF